MPDRMHLAVVALALAGALGGFLVGRWLHPAPEARRDAAALVGQAAPALDLPGLDGRRRGLDEWHGRPVLVNFWASWCPPCVEEMPLLDRAAQRFAGQGLVVVGVASDSPEATRAFLAAHPVGYPILIDDPAAPGRMRDASLAYGNTRSVLPYSVLVGRDGRILAQRFGNFSESGLDAWLQPHLD
jgi:thiol-disulfide isomerase/thioredoxin